MSDIRAPEEGRKPEELLVPPPTPKASAGALGLMAYGFSLFFLSFISVHARHITSFAIFVPCGLMFGGAAQFLAAILCYFEGSTFAFVTFAMYSAFYASIGIMFWPSSGAVSAYSEADFNQAFGLYMIVWAIITACMAVASTRTNLATFLVYMGALVVFVLSAAGHCADSLNTVKASGYFGFFTGAVSIYAATSIVWADTGVAIPLPLISLDRKRS